MEFDPKCFFEHPPRMKEDLKEYLKHLGRKIVLQIVQFARVLFESERIGPKHIKLTILAICPEPITVYNRNGLCVQNVKLKPIHKVLCRAIDLVAEACGRDKYGGLDKKICKSCLQLLREHQDIKCSHHGMLAIASVVSEICGILLQSAVANQASVKTLTLDMLKTYGILHKSSNGANYPYSSMIRFLNIIDNFKVSDVKEATKKEHVYEESRSKEKRVSFQRGPHRPSTPDICFWEDDD